MAEGLNKKQLDFLATSTQLPKDQIISSYLSFKKFINKDGLIDLKNFTEFYCKLLPKKSNSDLFCKFIFNGKLVRFNIGYNSDTMCGKLLLRL